MYRDQERQRTWTLSNRGNFYPACWHAEMQCCKQKKFGSIIYCGGFHNMRPERCSRQADVASRSGEGVVQMLDCAGAGNVGEQVKLSGMCRALTSPELLL